MRTLTRAFFEGYASATLAGRWQEQNKLDPFGAVQVRWRICLYFFCALLVLLMVSLIGIPSSTSKLMFTLAITLTVIGAVLSALVVHGLVIYFTNPVAMADLRFMRDCNQLYEFMTFPPGFLNSDQLEETSLDRLTNLALHLLRKEKHSGRGPESEAQREEFKSAHALMRRFGLADEKWNIYFTQAEQRIAEHTAT